MKPETRTYRVKYTEDVLGLSPRNFQKTDAKLPPAKIAEEAEVQAAMPEDLTTCFPRDPQGLFFWDYQWRGFFKEGFRAQIELGAAGSLSKWLVGKAVDNFLFVTPRRIYFKRDGLFVPDSEGVQSRSLRAQTMQGERICLATSERLAAGVTQEFSIMLFETSAKSKNHISWDLIENVLAMGQVKGTGQWRGGGWGTFTFERVGKV